METVNLQSMVKAATPNTPSVAISPGRSNEEKLDVKLSDSNFSGKQLPESEEGRGQEREKIEEKVSELNSFVQNIQRGIQFSVHEETGRSIISITDKDTGEEIRRFPSEQVLSMSAKIAETLAVPGEKGLGLLVNGKA